MARLPVPVLATALDAATTGLRPLRDAAGQAAIDLGQRLFDSNRVSGMGWLRRRMPVAVLGDRVAVVTRRADVLEVLADPGTYPLPYGKRLAGGFVLGLRGDAFERQRAELSAALRPEDLPGLRDLAARQAETCLRVARPTGRCDVGPGLVHPVLEAIVEEYMGIPGPDGGSLLPWARAMFQDIFLNAFDDPRVHERGTAAAEALGRHVDRVVAARRAAPPRDDVLGRLLASQEARSPTALADDGLGASLIGVAVGWLWHGAKACLLAVDELLERPDALALARSAARDGDDEGLRRVLWEALRFRPVQAGLPRTCAHAAVVAPGSDRARRVPAEATVFVGTHSAMWDETAVPDPGRFDPARADGQYLIFGSGPHRCLGERIMQVQMPALLAPLLRGEGLRRADGRAGRLRWAGPTPESLVVRLPA